MTSASVGRSTSSNGVSTNTAALRPARSSAAWRSRAVRRSSAPRSSLVVPPLERRYDDDDVADPIRRHAGPDDVARARREEAHRVVGLVDEERDRGPGLEPGDSLVRDGERPDLVLGQERFLAVPRDRRAGEHRERERGGHDDGERSTPLEPVPHADEPERREDRDREPERHEPIRGQPPRDERERHADEREHEPRAQDPAGVAVRRGEADERRAAPRPTGRTASSGGRSGRGTRSAART